MQATFKPGLTSIEFDTLYEPNDFQPNSIFEV